MVIDAKEAREEVFALAEQSLTDEDIKLLKEIDSKIQEGIIGLLRSCTFNKGSSWSRLSVRVIRYLESKGYLITPERYGYKISW